MKHGRLSTWSSFRGPASGPDRRQTSEIDHAGPGRETAFRDPRSCLGGRSMDGFHRPLAPSSAFCLDGAARINRAYARWREALKLVIPRLVGGCPGPNLRFREAGPCFDVRSCGLGQRALVPECPPSAGYISSAERLLDGVGFSFRQPIGSLAPHCFPGVWGRPRSGSTIASAQRRPRPPRGISSGDGGRDPVPLFSAPPHKILMA